jgi:hypothetical protein
MEDIDMFVDFEVLKEIQIERLELFEEKRAAWNVRGLFNGGALLVRL